MASKAVATSSQMDEHDLDAAAKADIIHIFRTETAISTSRESYLSTTLAVPFTFHIPKMGLQSKGDMERVIERHWMPWLRKVYDWTRMFGICPYYFERRGAIHQVPIVPDIELGRITVSVNPKTRKLEYKWYWTPSGINMQMKHDKSILWVITDRAPTRSGTFRSLLASLLPRYRTLVILRRSLERASTQNTHLAHILEYHPSAGTASNDNLTQMVANFGEKAAGLSKARQEIARSKNIQVRTSELMQQIGSMNASHAAIGAQRQTRLMWTDTDASVLERMDTGLNNMIPLRPDFKYVSPARSTVMAELEKYQNAFDVDAAAAMGYAYELIRPTGSSRTQNVRGGERFVNERAKDGIAFFTMVAHSALIIAYDKPLREGFTDFSSWHVNRRGGDQHTVAELHPEIDVEVFMSSAPMITYETLEKMWQDGILSKQDFANHAFQINAMPLDQVQLFSVPDMDGRSKAALAKPKVETKKGEEEKEEGEPLTKKVKTSEI